MKYRRVTHRRVADLTPEEQEALNDKIKVFFESTDSPKNSDDVPSTCPLNEFVVTDENVLKLTPDRLLFMDIHPRSDIIAIAGCDRKGTIGLVVKVRRISRLPAQHIYPSSPSPSMTCTGPGARSTTIFIPNMPRAAVSISSHPIESIRLPTTRLSARATYRKISPSK